MTVKKINIKEIDDKTAYWLIEGSMNNDWKLIVKVEYVDIYSAGYVYNIEAYCLDTKIKIQYLRVKSYRSLLTDASAISEYFANGGELCETLADFGFFHKNMRKTECKEIEQMLLSIK